MVLPYDSLAAMIFLNISEAILFDAVLEKNMLAPKSAIARLRLKVELVWNLYCRLN